VFLGRVGDPLGYNFVAGIVNGEVLCFQPVITLLQELFLTAGNSKFSDFYFSEASIIETILHNFPVIYWFSWDF